MGFGGHAANGGHLVQFFGGDEGRLVRNVARYLSETLREGGGGLVVAGRDRRQAIHAETCALLGESPSPDHLVLLDQYETLDRFMVGGRPDAALFDATVGAIARELQGRCGAFRAYGEMVGALWTQGNSEAAAALEELWNALRRSIDFGLYCGYPLDVLGEEFQVGSVRGVIASHTEVVSGLSPAFEFAMGQVMDEALGSRGHGLGPRAGARFPSLEASVPPAEGAILRLRSTLPRYADDVIERARLLSRYDGHDGLHMHAETGQNLDVQLGTEPLH